jgi:hypothetical protein
MHVFLLTLGRGLAGPAHLHGALFVADDAIYFVCTYVGRLDLSKLSPDSPIGRAVAEYSKTGTVTSLDTTALKELVAAKEYSVVLTPPQIELISRSMWTGSKFIHDGGKKLVVWNPGFAGKLRVTIRDWAKRHGVKTKGL